MISYAAWYWLSGQQGRKKTTTLYSSLHYLSSPHFNIITLEDPIEMVHKFNQVNATED